MVTEVERQLTERVRELEAELARVTRQRDDNHDIAMVLWVKCQGAGVDTSGVLEEVPF